MAYFNILGLVIMVIIMIPNIIFATKAKNVKNKKHNKIIEVIEQVGRFGSMVLMVFPVPLLNYGYWFTGAKAVYILLIGLLTISYCLVWALYFQNATMGRALALAILPTSIFLCSGIILSQLLLLFSALLFGIGHITITYIDNK